MLGDRPFERRAISFYNSRRCRAFVSHKVMKRPANVRRWLREIGTPDEFSTNELAWDLYHV